MTNNHHATLHDCLWHTVIENRTGRLDVRGLAHPSLSAEIYLPDRAFISLTTDEAETLACVIAPHITAERRTLTERIKHLEQELAYAQREAPQPSPL